MELATDTIDQEDYEAKFFDSQPASWIKEHRLALQCTNCQSPAYFRKRSVSGQGACFGASPHAEGCDLATKSNEEGERAEAVEKDIRENPGGHFDLRLDLPKRAAKNTPVSAAGSGVAGNKAGRFTKWGAKQASSSSIAARQMLINLAISEKYRESTQTVSTPQTNGKIQIRDYFIRFQDATAAGEGQERGYWGTIMEPGDAGDGTWINTGTQGNLSIFIPKPVETEFFLAYGIDGWEDLVGAYMMVVGELKVSKNGKNRKYVKPLAAKNIVVYIPKGNEVVDTIAQ